MKYEWADFDELTSAALYDVLALRVRVFQIEQRCFYPDVDGQDKQAAHLLVWQADSLVGYLRCYSQGQVIHIGRVVVAMSHRGQGIARRMMQHVFQRYCGVILELSAQAYLQDFYRSLGFVTQGEPYDDYGIMHVTMQCTATSDDLS